VRQLLRPRLGEAHRQGRLGEAHAAPAASEAYWRLPFTKLKAKADELGRPCRVFCASMADVFETHPDLPPLRERLWDVIEQTPWIDWQLLTKRPRSVQLMAPWGDDWPANVWIGTSIGAPEHTWRATCSARSRPPSVHQRRAAARQPLRRQAAAVARRHPVGDRRRRVGRQGAPVPPRARARDPRPLRRARPVRRRDRPAFFVKQLGAKPVYLDDLTIGVYAEKPLKLAHAKGEDIDEWPVDLRIREFPASRAREPEAVSPDKEKGSCVA
jgi:protein gp37